MPPSPDAALEASSLNLKTSFDYEKAFSRNLGILLPYEQEHLRKKCVAIPGCGGVGGLHAITLARLGVQNFVLADFDIFELPNFNRQYGARMSHLQSSKVDVMKNEILDINPQAQVRVLRDGITPENIDLFLDRVDLVIDSLDFYAHEARDLLFRRAGQNGIPVITAAPLGMTTAWLVFDRHGMSYEQYFDFKKDDPESLRVAKFLMGLAPQALHRNQIHLSFVDVHARRAPSVGLAIDLCAGVAAAEALKILSERKNVKSAPFYSQFDAERTKLAHGKLRFGNRSLLQRIKIWFAHKQILKLFQRG